MDLIVNELLHPWRLKARKQEDDWCHDLPSGTERWEYVKYLGSGTFGDVLQERCVSTLSRNKVRAVKRVSKRPDHPSLPSRREIEALITFSDTAQPQFQEHFVRFLGWFEDPMALYLAMEFVEHGNLQAYINQGIFPEEEAAAITAQLAKALHYMHQKEFVHRDFKPSNILVSQVGPQWRVKVADFGIAKNTVGTAARTNGVGSLGYMAPELFGPMGSTYTSAVDVWALGAVAFCMRTGYPPFSTLMEQAEYSRGQTNIPWRPLGDSSGFCMNFIMDTTERSHEKRLTIQQVLVHDWLKQEETRRKATTSSRGINPGNEWSNTYDGASTVPRPRLKGILKNGSQEPHKPIMPPSSIRETPRVFPLVEVSPSKTASGSDINTCEWPNTYNGASTEPRPRLKGILKNGSQEPHKPTIPPSSIRETPRVFPPVEVSPLRTASGSYPDACEWLSNKSECGSLPGSLPGSDSGWGSGW
ncbi:kinase-like domain-containing protein [Astrocystis sublimbata]|nr:kinase-like domain-containing protein [Astrocystis sublimbata]